MATIREWLDGAGFDWTNGRIIHQPVGNTGSPGWAEPTAAEEVDADHPILDHEFYSGHGGPECPRFIARDRDRIYFPSQYDGATEIESVHVDVAWYLDPKHETPYPGG